MSDPINNPAYWEQRKAHEQDIAMLNLSNALERLRQVGVLCAFKIGSQTETTIVIDGWKLDYDTMTFRRIEKKHPVVYENKGAQHE